MTDQTDHQLLKTYAERRLEPAFTELVSRHVDFVYSAAMRMVRDSHLAEDVTQSVFIALAKQAPDLVERATLAGWLHRTAQNIACQTVRTIERRRAREQESVAMNELFSSSPETSWEQIEPHLDAALGELSDVDRDAVLLRYFQKKSAAEIASILGGSDEAAQKRLSRAVEQLRESFARKKITIGAGGFVAVVSTNAVQAAPAELAATISAAALLTGTAVSSSTLISASKTIAMTILQKTIITAAVAVVAGAGLYDARQASQLREQNQTFRQQQATLALQLLQLQRERDDATNQLAGLLADNARLRSNSNQNELLKLRGEVTKLRALTAKTGNNDARESLVKSWLAREDQLKQTVQQFQSKSIPEFQLLSEQQWLDQAMNAKFDSDTDIQRTLADLRHQAENNFASLAQNALSKYLKANDGRFPADLTQLQTYFTSPVDDSILQRWEIAPASVNPSVGVGQTIITQIAPVDGLLDQRWAIGASGFGAGNWESPEVGSALASIKSVMQAYAAANNGSEPTDPSQLLPYLTTPQQQAAYQTLLKKFPANNLGR